MIVRRCSTGPSKSSWKSTLSVKPFADLPDIKEDVPISLTSVDFQDYFEGPVEQRRTIIYNMSFDMRINFYGPEDTNPIIREVNTNLNIIQDDSDVLGSLITTTPNPIDVSPDDDYGFDTLITTFDPELWSVWWWCNKLNFTKA